MSLHAMSRLLSLVLMLLAVGCGKDDEVASAPDPELPEPPFAVVVSNVIGSAGQRGTGRAGGGNMSGSAADVPIAYVSLLPGAIPHGATVMVRNMKSGAETSAALLDGGADPIGVTALEGNALRIVATDSTGASYTYVTLMKRHARPRVVRTDPAPQKTAVPLNAVIRVVFSEPVDLSSVESSVHVRQASGPVAGTVRLVDGSPGVIDFVPADPLARGTNYTLDIGAGVLDLDGDPLLAAVAVPFTTSGSVPPTAPPSVDMIALRGFNMSMGASALFLVRPDGGDMVNLRADGWEPAWSADGMRIAFVESPNYARYSFDLYTVNVDGSRLTRLTTGSSARTPTWSPDGTQIAFTSERADGTDIYLTTATGSHVTRLTQDRISSSPAWSPDGSKILFARGPSLYVMNPDGSGATVLHDVGGSPAWSHDGARIAYNCGGICVSNADGTGMTRLTTDQADAWLDRRPAWSPDGSELIFARIEMDGGDWFTTVFRINADGTGLRPLGISVLGGNGNARGYQDTPAWRPRPRP